MDGMINKVNTTKKWSINDQKQKNKVILFMVNRLSIHKMRKLENMLKLIASFNFKYLNFT